MPDEGLLAERERLEAVRVELHDRGVVDPLQQVAPPALLLRRHAAGAPGAAVSTNATNAAAVPNQF